MFLDAFCFCASRLQEEVDNKIGRKQSPELRITAFFIHGPDGIAPVHVLALSDAPPGRGRDVRTASIDPATEQTLSSINASGTTTTATLAGHSFTTGDTVVLTGAADAGYNGTFVITVTGSDTFDYTLEQSASAQNTASTLKATKPLETTYSGESYAICPRPVSTAFSPAPRNTRSSVTAPRSTRPASA